MASDLRIPVLDLHPEIEVLWDELTAAIQGVLRSAQFIMGPNVKAFETEVAAYLGTKHAIAVNSGTDALVISLEALGIGPGDEVITTPFTFFATPEAISSVGATPVFVDIDPATFNIDASLIPAAITSRTKAIIPVHLFGLAADMDPILAAAQEHGLRILEDVAQAFGGLYRGSRLGTIGDAGAFSFFPSKNLGAYGDGGLIATDSDQMAARARMLRSHGAKRKYENEMIGYNSRLDEIQAAILRVKLPHIDNFNASRRAVAMVYNDLFSGDAHVILPGEPDWATPVYHQYTIRVRAVNRDAIRERLADSGIGSMIYYPVPCHELPCYRETPARMPIAEAAAREVLSLPIWPQMEAHVQAEVVSALRVAST